MRINKIIVFILISIFSTSVIASPPPDKLGWHWLWNNGCIHFDFQHPYKLIMFDKNDGKKFPNDTFTASKYLSLWEEVLNKIHESVPHLSPNEIEWLEGELNSKNSNRYGKAYESIEYHQSRMLNLMHTLLSLITMYNQESNPKEKKKILYRFAWRLDSDSGAYSASYIELKRKGLITEFPDNWNGIKSYIDDVDRYYESISYNWGKARDFIIKCYVSDY